MDSYDTADEDAGSAFLFRGGLHAWGSQLTSDQAELEIRGLPGERLGGADLDGDGRDDWLVSGTDPASVYLIYDTASHLGSTLSSEDVGAKVLGAMATWISTGDFDGDGVPDVAVAAVGSDDEEVYLIANPGLPRSGTVELSDVALGFRGTNATVDLGDATGDGLDDLLIADPALGTAWLIAGR